MNVEIKCSICNVNFRSENSHLTHIKETHAEQYSIFINRLLNLDNTGYIFEENYEEIEQKEISTVKEESSLYITSDCSRKIISWEPDNFNLEATTIWSFPNRGKWATHNPKYRGNWSPYIPRNIILRYSMAGDYVLDQFLGVEPPWWKPNY